MVIVGSVIGLENSQAFGCVIGLEMLSIGNLIFLIISSILLYKAIKTNDPKIVIKLVAFETIIWIAKYLFYKGGYVTGFGGTANPINVIYDFVAIGIRIWVLILLLSKSKYSLIGAIISSLLLVILKINVFAFPWFTKTMWELEDKRTEKQKTEIVGNYSGTILQLSNNQVRQIELRIDTAKLTFINDQPFNFKKEYHFGLDYPNIGGIATDQGLEYDVSIEKMNKDSLIIYFEDMLEKKYKLKLKTER